MERLRLSGHELLFSRIAALTIVALLLELFIFSIPARYQELVRIALRLNPSPLEQSFQATYYAELVLAIEISVVLAFTLTALLIIWRRSEYWLLIFVAVAHVGYAVYAAPPLDALMRANPEWVTLGNIAQAFGFGCALHFFYLFPDGRWIPRGMRFFSILWLLWSVAWVAFPTSFFNLGDPFSFSTLSFALTMAWWITGLYTQFYRYRHVYGPVERQQTKWIIFALLVGVSGYALIYVLGLVLPLLDRSALLRFYSLYSVPIFMLSLITIPLLITMSVFRYRLWDIDILIRRTLLYSAWTGILALVYFASIVLLQSLLRTLTGEGQNRIVTVISTLAIAALAAPVRHYLQNFIDQRFYRRRYDAVQTLAMFHETVRDVVELDELAARLVAVVEDTMQPAHVSLWLRPPKRPVTTSEDGLNGN
jgi:hypothetical protein